MSRISAVIGGIVIAEAAGAVVLRGGVAGHPGVGVIGASAALVEPLAELLRDAGFALEDA